MELDVGGALATTASPGISRDTLDELDSRVERIHERIETARENGDDGYVALDLPVETDPATIHTAVDSLPDPEAVIVAGIGGSALGTATIVDALDADCPVYTLDNVDPAAVNTVLEEVPLEESVLVGVSRSGTTAETLANFLIVRDAMATAGADWTARTLVITGTSGPLAEMAEEHDLARLSVPDGVPGRYSALSAVALAPAALAGVSIEPILAGGATARGQLRPSLYDCPAYAYGATSYALAARGAQVNAMMPYSEQLETFAEWFAQLWAESLGKDGLGQVPVRALGVTDQHSQLQLYRDGPRSVVVSTIDISSRPSCPIPEPNQQSLSYLSGIGLEELIAAERRATQASIEAAGRPTMGITLPELSPETVGELLYTMEAACIMAGELFGIDPFTQPAVEWGKRATRGLLRGVTTAETQTIKDRTELRITAPETED